MSQSPADDYGTPDRTGASPREGADGRSVFRRVVARAREGVSRVRAAIGQFVRSDPPGAERREELPDRHETRESTHESHLMVTTSDASETPETPEPETDSLPERNQVFTHPARGDGEENPPRPVARMDGEKLTVELPDEPDATITSDVWERVEP